MEKLFDETEDWRSRRMAPICSSSSKLAKPNSSMGRERD